MADLDALRRLGRTAEVWAVPGVYQKPALAHSREVDRVLALPEHPGYSAADHAALERALRRPGGTMHLRPCQADALLAALDADGLFAPLPVGAGKTLIDLLLPTVLHEKRRPLVLTTAALLAQLRKMEKEYRAHWWLRDDLRFMSYHELSRPDGTALLARLAPDLVIADEGHALRDPKSARTKRFLRHFKAHPGTTFCVLSGTMTKRSVKDYAKALHLALRDWTPLPRDWAELTAWAQVLDPDHDRPAGALLLLPHEDPAADARARFARRLRKTRGVAAQADEALGATLRIEVVAPPTTSLALARARSDLRMHWTRLDGAELTTVLELALVDRQLRLGGCYLWTTPPAPGWLRARNAWHRAVRQWLKAHAKEGLDSPALLERAVVRGEVELPEYAAWAALKHEPEPPKAWRWLDESVVAWLADRVRAHAAAGEPVCTFANVVAVGRRLAELAGVPYYGEGPAAAAAIVEEKGDRSIVCSLEAHYQGRNLQGFARGLLVAFPPTGAKLEQVLGRLHRSGQTADEVVFEVILPYAGELAAAAADARFIQEVNDAPQKLCYATIDWGLFNGEVDEVAKADRPDAYVALESAARPSAPPRLPGAGVEIVVSFFSPFTRTRCLALAWPFNEAVALAFKRVMHVLKARGVRGPSGQSAGGWFPAAKCWFVEEAPESYELLATTLRGLGCTFRWHPPEDGGREGPPLAFFPTKA